MSAPSPTAIVLSAPMGPAGLLLLTTYFLPLLGLPSLVPWGALANVVVVVWAAVALAILAAFCLGTWVQVVASFRGGWGIRVLGGLMSPVLFAGFAMASGTLSGVLLMPPGLLTAAVVALGSADGFPRGGYAHRVVSDLLLFYALLGAAVGAWGLKASWSRGPTPAPKPLPRGLRIALFAGLLVGALALGWGAALGRFHPALLAEIIEPTLVER